jgi:hypothetical protein
MDADRFDGLARALSRTPSRRAVSRGLAGLAAGPVLAPLLDWTASEAKKKRKKKCKGGKKKCGKKCIDIQNDANNCGGCGKLCAPGQACEQGSCPGGSCDAIASTVAQLHDALEVAAVKNGYVICLEAGTYNLPSEFFNPLGPEATQLVLPGNTSLLGAGAGQTILKGAASGFESVISMSRGHLAWLTVTGGVNDEGSGGGLANGGTSSLTGCVISGNSAGYGGGIFSTPVGSLTLTDCTITGNTAHHSTGGGVLNSGVLVQLNTTITGNTSDDGIQCLNVGAGTGC